MCVFPVLLIEECTGLLYSGSPPARWGCTLQSLALGLCQRLRPPHPSGSPTASWLSAAAQNLPSNPALNPGELPVIKILKNRQKVGHCAGGAGLCESSLVEVLCFPVETKEPFPTGTRYSSTRGDASHAPGGEKAPNHRWRSEKAICRFKGSDQDAEITVCFLSAEERSHHRSPRGATTGKRLSACHARSPTV